MNADISKLLREWPFESGKLNVRLIQGEDGDPRVQMRLDLGILQMHVEGRPDGQRPRGFESCWSTRRPDSTITQPSMGRLQGLYLVPRNAGNCAKRRSSTTTGTWRCWCWRTSRGWFATPAGPSGAGPVQAARRDAG